MAGAPARPIILFFFCLSSLASSFPRSNASPHFDSFVLFGHIQLFNSKGVMSYRLQLSVALGNDVWLQNVESKYYTFLLPTRNYSGMVGRLSLLASDESATTLWNQSFSVQSEVGAFRLDIIDAGETLKTATSLGDFQVKDAGIDMYSKRTSTMVDVAHKLEGRTVIGFREPKSKHAHSKQFSERLLQINEEEAICPSVACPEFNPSLLFRERKFNGKLSKSVTGSHQLLHVPYPQQMISFATIVQECYLAFFFVVCFAFIQLLIALLHKSIFLLEVPLPVGDQLAEGEVLSSDNTDLGAWHLCLASLERNGGYFFDAESAQDVKHAGKTSLEEAWHVAEQYLNEAIESDCRGAYFSYNCTSPQQEAPESALGRWNRDNAGRLIRQLWA